MTQMVVDGGGSEPLAVTLVGGDVEIIVEILQGRRCHLEVVVVLNDGLRLLRREPPLFPVLPDDGTGLPVESLVIGLIVGVGGCRQLHADETAIARRIGKGAALVGGGDERGVALELLDVLAVGPLDLHAGQLDDVLQKPVGYDVKFSRNGFKCRETFPRPWDFCPTHRESFLTYIFPTFGVRMYHSGPMLVRS